MLHGIQDIKGKFKEAPLSVYSVMVARKNANVYLKTYGAGSLDRLNFTDFCDWTKIKLGGLSCKTNSSSGLK